MKWNYARALCLDTAATLDDLREAVRLLEDLAPTARRVLGSAHPVAAGIERDLRESRAALRAREGARSIREAVEAMTVEEILAMMEENMVGDA